MCALVGCGVVTNNSHSYKNNQSLSRARARDTCGLTRRTIDRVVVLFDVQTVVVMIAVVSMIGVCVGSLPMGRQTGNRHTDT
jgi:hypothetical protein